MIQALLAIHDAMIPVLTQGFVVLLRVGGLMLLLPGLGDRMIPMRIRLVITFALTTAVTPSLPLDTPVDGTLILVETTIGLALGAVLRFLASALTMAGMMAAQLTSLAQLFGSVEPSSAIGNLLNLAGIALLMASNLPLMVIDMIIRSYDVFPIGLGLQGDNLVAWGVSRAAQAFSLAFALAAPFALAALIYNAAMGVINRAMPQLMVALVGAPAITGASLVLLLLSAPLILSVWKTAMVAALADPILGGLP
ncbi:flagellar biosynthetic protein FliR [Jannaschia donghaensis]|uniref:Flagellar biosynthesis protein FliR n=1 Tax=Jannaschia donghaensis TaxID=420998 RepID=A0A0M6YHU5_9RHOB|nr:flagellar biosynthetic protein FliR [Jannaschia donghaensis]CTQ49093.1 flagellar biosynthesis protein FliR [Jannaschia donghaensis]